MELKTITAGGLEFGCLVAGSGPLALCLHGFPDTARTWRHLLPALAERGFRAVAPYARGYAPTQVPPDGAYDVGALVADACALHDAFGGDGDAVLVGHDWGAVTAYAATAFAPDRWRRAVTLAVPPAMGRVPGFLDYAQLKRSFYIYLFQNPRAEAAAARPGFLEGLWRDWSPGYDATADLAWVRESLGDPANLSAAIGYYRAMLGTTPPAAAYEAERAAARGQAGVPVLYLHGTRDGCLDAGLVAPAAAHLPEGSRAELVEGAGHFLHLERPGAINDMIIGWLADGDNP